MRSKRQKQSGQENIVVTSFFFMKIGNMATKLANVLCAIFPKNLGEQYPPYIVKLLKTKCKEESLRQASFSMACILWISVNSSIMCQVWTHV